MRIVFVTLQAQHPKNDPGSNSMGIRRALLGPIDFKNYLDGRIQWIITGCEQAGRKKRRAMEMSWVWEIDDQCRQANVAHFFKQYYKGSQLVHDGMLDGVVRQAWPK